MLQIEDLVFENYEESFHGKTRYNISAKLNLETGFSSPFVNSSEGLAGLKERCLTDMRYLMVQKLISRDSEEQSFMNDFLAKFESLDKKRKKSLNKFLIEKIREFK